MNILAQEIGDLLRLHKMTLGSVESATGGLISHLITSIPGSSDYFQGAIVSYSNDVKTNLVGVEKETLDKYGAVSAQVAEEMAAGGRKVLAADICIADTGIAGPTGATLGKPIGLFYIGISHKDGTFNRKYVFHGNREQNKEQAASAALTWLQEYLTNLGKNKGKTPTTQIKHLVTCFIEAEGKILIFRRINKIGSYQERWGSISGYIDKTDDEQAQKEVSAATGLSDKDVKLISKGNPLEILDEKLKIKWIVHPYLFYTRYPDKIKMDRENIESKWINPEDIDDYTTVPKLKETLGSVYQRKK